MSGQLMLYAKSGAIIALKIIAPLFFAVQTMAFDFVILRCYDKRKTDAC